MMHTASSRTWVPGAENKVETKWHLVDARGLVLGRLATEISRRLRGKHKATYTPHADVGDHVVVINAEGVVLTGRKRSQKVYHRHTGYPGGVKETRVHDLLEGEYAPRVLKMAVRRMIARGTLGRLQMKKLHVYRGETHPHGGQKLEKLDFGSMNVKNRLRSR
jgi:large subunit ribosomal protein L13